MGVTSGLKSMPPDPIIHIFKASTGKYMSDSTSKSYANLIGSRAGSCKSEENQMQTFK